MRKMLLVLMVVFYLGGLAGCAEWAAGNRQAGDNRPASGGGHHHMMPMEQGNDK